MSGARLYVRGFDRPNLLSIIPSGGAADKSERLAELVRMREGGVALVIRHPRKNARSMRTS
jgi:hypothetical protein